MHPVECDKCQVLPLFISFCAYYRTKSLNFKNRVRVLLDPTSVERNDRNGKENQREMSSISQKISGKIGELSCNSSGNSVFEAVFYASFKSSCMGGGGGASSLFSIQNEIHRQFWY